ncbi:hypothetical protein [Methanoculleus sp. 7T]|jgi:hypothetical protein|uniref:hypothetical protein n=1 Tax=Methanoculleus sp. 7T TaxID=2937282 RepID=UPI0020BFEA1D|nr:hypothetical protein [Methanoculleus sp. 7T]MCK8517691.1 hypothetical protein [Methanoculleus sp. 7T]
MAIRSFTLSEETQDKVMDLLSEVSLSQYYRSYDWGRDQWKTGFQDIVRLECTMIDAARQNSITMDHLLQIAQWSKLRSQNEIQITHQNPSIDLPLYSNGTYAEWIKDNPAKGIAVLNPQMKYFGKVSQSKLLRFAMPWEYGAIDKRLCQVFGRGDPASQHTELLSLKVVYNGTRWDLKYQQTEWPSEYGTWIQILRMIASELNLSGMPCPHPEVMYTRGLRKKGIWECADVEMALFSFASKAIGTSR